MKKFHKLLALLLALCMIASVLVGCGKDKDDDGKTDVTDPTTEAPSVSEDPSETEPIEDSPYPAKQVGPGSDAAASYTGGDTLVVAYDKFSQKFTPFFADSGYDQDVVSMVSIGLLGIDREGNVINNGIDGETRPYNGTDYLYRGIADLDVVENEDGTVDYNINLATNVKWSDGTPITIDDVLFTMYTLSDPTYDGSSSFYAVPIEGMEEYRNSMMSKTDYILSLGEDATDLGELTQEEYDAFWTAFYAGGEKFAQGIADFVLANYGEPYGAVDFASAVALWGYEAADAATMFSQMVEAYGYDISDAGINYEMADKAISEFIYDELGDAADSYRAGINVGEAVSTISGIVKTSDHSIRVRTTKVDAPAIYQMGITIAPLHYYGDPAKFDYENGKFGFDKGDLSKLRDEEHMTKPMGGGPYKFVSFDKGVVTFEANENYFLGQPKIKNILFQEVSNSDRISGIVDGTIDGGEIAMSTEVADVIKGYNTNGELVDGDVIYTSLIDNLGYGYVGVNAEKVNVAGDPGSDASKNLRKGLMTVLSVYRDSSVASYYAELAAVIEYPISNTSWAAPRPTDEGYQRAFSTDVDGNPIYTAEMTEEERYEAAKNAAIGFFKAAGYTFDEATGKFTAAPEGAKLEYELIVPADGKGDHPAFHMVTNAHNTLEEIGINLIINDPADSNYLWDTQDANMHELWAAAWGSTVDPDMYQVYHSANCIGAEGGTNSNKYNIKSEELDALIMEGRGSADQAYRKSIYTDALNVIMDWGIELATYQRKLANCFSAERINMSTMTPDQTPFWGWMNDIELLEMY
ncbi:MAG: ABC transporter substrate-binding protein [Ruminococcaceae bacterium]|nr:ABC transporter substrate-binding protein [Oscillospiraceae bacterium]